MNAWDKQRHKKKGLGCYNLWSFRVRVWAGGGQPLKFQVTAPLRVRGCFFGVLLVSTWRFPGLGRGGGGEVGRGGAGGVITYIGSTSRSNAGLTPKSSAALKRPPNPKPLNASKPQALKGLETPNLPRPKTFISVYGPGF